nr:serine/threonine-protein kinase EDR1-like isoform X2 [Tanacetum cinerariifolium]
MTTRIKSRCDVSIYGVVLWGLCTMQEPLHGMNAVQVVGAVGFQHHVLKFQMRMNALAVLLRKKESSS